MLYKTTISRFDVEGLAVGARCGKLVEPRHHSAQKRWRLRKVLDNFD